MWWLKFVAIPWSISFVVGYVGALLPHVEVNRFLDDREAALLLGGQCPHTDCVVYACGTEGCGVYEIDEYCTLRQNGLCEKIVKQRNVVRCVGPMQQASECFETTSGETCYIKYHSQPDEDGNCSFYACQVVVGACGSTAYTCTSAICPPGP